MSARTQRFDFASKTNTFTKLCESPESSPTWEDRWAAVRWLPASLGLQLREILMLVRSNRARDVFAVSGSFSQLRQLVHRRLAIAQMGLAEAQRHLAAGQAEDAGIVLDKIDEDLHLLRCRLDRETETVAPRTPVFHGSAN